jgi:hypothetical protein
MCTDEQHLEEVLRPFFPSKCVVYSLIVQEWFLRWWEIILTHNWRQYTFDSREIVESIQQNTWAKKWTYFNHHASNII